MELVKYCQYIGSSAVLYDVEVGKIWGAKIEANPFDVWERSEGVKMDGLLNAWIGRFDYYVLVRKVHLDTGLS